MSLLALANHREVSSVFRFQALLPSTKTVAPETGAPLISVAVPRMIPACEMDFLSRLS